MKTKFYIFRHGETFATKRGTWYGTKIYSADLLPEARPALERMGKYLQNVHTDYQVSSQVKRCKQTTEIISSYTKWEFVYDNRLNEFFLETFWHLLKRVRSLLREIEEKEYKSVAICTHGGVIAVLLQLLSARKSINPFSLFNFPPPGVLTIIEGDTIQQINFNQLEHETTQTKKV